MDLGVGSFVFAAGLVAPEARTSFPASGGSLAKCAKSCVPLVILGLARLVTVTVTGYHEHVSEYGLHWNFFFTLAAVKLLSSMVLPLIPSKLTWVLSVLLAVLYEGLLTFWLGDWIMSDAPRTDLITANREGLCSCLGYVAIYIAGVAWGQQVCEVRSTWSEVSGLGRLLSVWVVLMWASLVYSATLFLPPSRRLANYTFYTWIVAYNLTLLALFVAIDLFVVAAGEIRILPGPALAETRHRTRESNREGGRENPPKKFPKKGESSSNATATNASTTAQANTKVMRIPNIYAAMSYNGLTFFLLANLATGLVNMVFRTIEMQGCPAVLLLSGYVALLCLVATLLHRWRIRLKFW